MKEELRGRGREGHLNLSHLMRGKLLDEIVKYSIIKERKVKRVHI